MAACLRSTGTKVKTQGAVTAVDGNKRGDLELVGYIGDGAQDLVLDFSMRHYRGGAAPRNWHRNGELLHPGRPDKDLDEKAASKIERERDRVFIGNQREQLQKSRPNIHLATSGPGEARGSMPCSGL